MSVIKTGNMSGDGDSGDISVAAYAFITLTWDTPDGNGLVWLTMKDGNGSYHTIKTDNADDIGPPIGGFGGGHYAEYGMYDSIIKVIWRNITTGSKYSLTGKP